MTVTAILVPDDALLFEVQEIAERAGLVLVTDGHELKYTLPHHIPPGYRRFAMTDKNAGRIHKGEKTCHG